EIQWPYPQRLIVPPLVSYGYENEVWLLTQITPPADLPDGQNVTLRAQADWLVCEQVCLPAEAELSLQLPVRKGAPALDARWKDAFARTRAQLPVPAAQLGYTVGVERAPGDNGGFVLSFRPPAQKAFAGNLAGAYFFAGEAATLDLAAPQKVTRAGDA